MRDIRLQKLAHLIINYSLNIKKGEYLQIRGSVVTEPLLKELYREALKVGAYPEITTYLEGVGEILLKEGNDEQLNFVSPVSRTFAEKYDATIHLLGGVNTKELAGVDPQRIVARRRAMKEIIDIQQKREAKGEYRWCLTQFPTHSDAQEGNMSLDEYADFVFKAGLIDKEDPTAEWKKISEQQEKVVKYLDQKKEIHIISKDTDLKMRTEGRKWINCDGKVNFPDGEVFTGPVEDSVEGYIRFSFPGIYAGKEIEDIRLTFEKGKVVKAEAAKGEELLLAILDTDQGSRTLGEIAIGTNYGIQQFTRNMLFDEKIGGTVHAAVGSAYPSTNAKNESSIHWDMLCDMRDGGKIYADGELFYENGEFLFDVIEKGI
ncbi:Leucyl aminopeptidase (aminopeptidase T) [Proteiniborus ethanoligenes]|uniref:Leucyl aminopeptidase (Aminopeptidase T) n=1 Tax=Proteiniborus ethanoligenes TaxID=415015 RepID=A0A1H3P8Z7_9FIRM|nr:aminopeptidase [Proteiniborus ethanoligenes]TAH61569.1 MAG: aminopeptidase [Gottschalkiaceae bacterium]SDY96859.1 Leucyl aminopeptidase (aminopeptidase T) [Proteiniborus ethanoligenes]